MIKCAYDDLEFSRIFVYILVNIENVIVLSDAKGEYFIINRVQSKFDGIIVCFQRENITE